MKKKLFIGAVTLLCALPLSAQEKSSVKLNLPDGPYQIQGGCSFIIKDNQFYTSPGALRTFGVAKLNEWFSGKKFKYLFAGEKIGQGYYEKISNEIDLKQTGACMHLFQPDKSKPYAFKSEKVTKEPLYLKDSVFNNGSVTMALTVPQGHKETPREIYRTISIEEVAAVEKLAKEQLFAELKKLNEIKHTLFVKLNTQKISEKDFLNSKLVSLDKILRGNDVMYIGAVNFRKGLLNNGIAFFSVKNNIVNLVSFYDDLSVSGMLDVDGCGEEELLIVKRDVGLDEATIWLEVYKQQKDGSWTLIIKSKELAA